MLLVCKLIHVQKCMMKKVPYFYVVDSVTACLIKTVQETAAGTVQCCVENSQTCTETQEDSLRVHPPIV